MRSCSIASDRSCLSRRAPSATGRRSSSRDEASVFASSTIFRTRSPQAWSRWGSSAGDRVTLYAPNSWEWIVSYYGALKTGAVINPVNVMLTPAEVAYVTKDCGAKALIGTADKIRPAVEAGVTGLNAIVFGQEPPQARRRSTSSSPSGRNSSRSRSSPRRSRQSDTPPARPGIRRARCSPIAPSSSTPR